MKIFVTGVTGFIGSHLVRALVTDGHEVLALRREKSSLVRCRDFEKSITWINQDASEWVRLVSEEKPAFIIHAAWTGVTAAEREDWDLQSTNLVLLADLFRIAGNVSLEHFIAFGSQAEYGTINGRVTEACPCLPNTAYGATKLAALTLLQAFARQQKMTYTWLRLFSIYGPGEAESWFIPNLIRKMKLGQSPQLSGCEQRYDYLHVYDLAAALQAVIQQPEKAGVYNLTSNTSLPLKQIVQLIKDYSGCRVEPGFSALRYRPGQSMHIEGDSTRFYKAFGFQPHVGMPDGLAALVENAEPTDEMSHYKNHDK